MLLIIIFLLFLRSNYVIPYHFLVGLFNLQTNVNFVAMGLAYFLSLDVGMSIWLFHLFTMGQIAVENILGYSIPGRRDLFMEGSMSVAYQGMGAMLVLVFYGLWNSRSHLHACLEEGFF